MPPLLRLPMRFLSDRLKGLGSWCGAAFWWLLEWAGDKLLGDTAFGWLRDMVSPFAQYAWITLLWTYGIPLGLVALGAYFFMRSGKTARSEALVTASPQIKPAEAISVAPAPAQKPSIEPVETTTSHRPTRQGSAAEVSQYEKRSIRPEASQLMPGWETLYRVQEDGGIELAFAPDTKQPKKDAFVLLLYAYFVLYGDEKIGARRIYGDMNRNFDKVWKRFQNQQASLWEFVGSMNIKDWGQEAIDAGLAMRVDLATTPSFRLTIYGQSHAYDLAQSLIARA